MLMLIKEFLLDLPCFDLLTSVIMVDHVLWVQILELHSGRRLTGDVWIPRRIFHFIVGSGESRVMSFLDYSCDSHQSVLCAVMADVLKIPGNSSKQFWCLIPGTCSVWQWQVLILPHPPSQSINWLLCFPMFYPVFLFFGDLKRWSFNCLQRIWKVLHWAV